MNEEGKEQREKSKRKEIGQGTTDIEDEENIDTHLLKKKIRERERERERERRERRG